MYSVIGQIMHVQVIKMRQNGVALERRYIADRAIAYDGALVIMDVTDQGLRRPVKVARLRCAPPRPTLELLEPHIVWAAEGRFTLTGVERVKNDAGQLVDFAQSWLCVLIVAPADSL